MDRDSGVRAAVAALTAAAAEDRATGGVDLERGIYPVVKICTSEGHSDASEEEIASCYRSILEARRAGGNL
jgi:proteasome beta subunit